jgi:hypothetical protein
MMIDKEKLVKWRLLLGDSVDEKINSINGELPLSEEQKIMDQALSSIYDNTGGKFEYSKKSASTNAGRVSKWLSDIREIFREDVVSVIQNDAIEKKGLKSLLFEPEVFNNIQPNIELVGTLMSMRGMIPEKAKDNARLLIRKVVDEIRKKLENEIRQSVVGALNRRKHSPMPDIKNIDWKYTINKNIKNFNSELERIIPDRFYFFSKNSVFNNYHIIIDMDQSGSMADSIVYGSIMGSIISSIPAVKTRVVAFDTEIVDLTEQCGNDPVEMIFGIQLGGGTDINKSVAYCEKFIENPSRTILFILSDLIEGGNQSSLLRRLENLYHSQVKVICLLALTDRGTPSYDEDMAKKISKMGIPCFACTPGLLPSLLDAAISGRSLKEFEKTGKK